MSRLTDTRVYVLKPTNGADHRLLRASNKARALRMSAAVCIASQDDIARLVGAGVVIETEIPKPAPPPRPKLHAQRRA
jgi:hypothetical protein